MRKSVRMSLTAVFAALHAVLYSVSFRLGLWRNWGIYLESVEGIVLGPKIGFLAVFIGSLIARILTGFSDVFWMFGIVAEPFSVLIAGLLVRRKWKPVLTAYVIMLSAYFVHPFGRALPLWTILDVLFALLLIYPAARLSQNLFKTDIKHLSITLVLVSFVCIATDSLIRIFLLVPCNLYSLFPGVFGSFEGLYAVFVGSAVDSYIEDAMVVIVSFLVGVPLLVSISKLKPLEQEERPNRERKSLY
jgi:hypothetical protein